jgi:multidrug efflux pump subunit AcrB
VAVGLLLDDTIVVIENIERHCRRAKSVRQAIRDGLDEIILADWSGTYTTVIVLVPIMFVGGYVQQILRPFTTVLAIALLSSFLISVTIIPLLSPLVMGRSQGSNIIERIVGKICNGFLERLQDFFTTVVHFALSHKFIFIMPAIALLVFSMKVVMPLAGRDLMPPMDTGILKIAFDTEANTSLAATEQIARQIEETVFQEKGVQLVATMVGSESGVISFGTGRTPQQGMITAHFTDRFHRKRTIWEIEDAIRKKCVVIPGIRNLDVYDFGATPLSSIAASVDILITGPDATVLDSLADEVEKRLMNVRGLTTVHRSWTLDKRELLIDIDMEKAAIYGLDPVVISREITSALTGTSASVLRIPGEDGVPIRVRYDEKARNSIKSLEEMYISTAAGPVPLREIASFRKHYSRTRFTRQDLMPSVDIYGYRATTAITHLQPQIEDALSDMILPQGYTLSHEGEIKNMNEAGKRLAKALLLAVILLYFSLVPTFRSWLHPVVIMVAIPLSMIGGAWGLVLVGRHACMPANMGMILLAGIVVNNSILLIDFIEQARKKGTGIKEAIEQSVRVRTRPILMTAFSTIVGMIPIAAQQAVGLERLSPLAVVAIGGLFVATFLTLVYVPIFYELFETLKKRLSALPKSISNK